MEKIERTTLQAMRREAGLRQVDLGRLMVVSHSRLSVIERTAPWDQMVRTVGSYVDGLGGRLELWVAFEDGRMVRLEIDRAG
jgi:hypothetical protein